MIKTPRKILSLVVSVLLMLALVACNNPFMGQQSFRRGNSGDMCLSESAGPCIGSFLEDYPDMKVTKVRWQSLEDGTETYVIEGNNGRTKSVVKYLIEGTVVLGRVERAFGEIELSENGKCKEKPLKLTNLLTLTELQEIASKELGGVLHELLVNQTGKFATAYVEARYTNHDVRGIYINALTGEILR